MHNQTFNLQQWSFCHALRTAQVFQLPKHINIEFHRHVKLKQQIIRLSHTYMHLTHNKTYLSRIFPKDLWTSMGSMMNPKSSSSSSSSSPVSYPTNIHLSTLWIFPQISSKISNLWLARWFPPCPILSLLVLAWLDQGPLSQCKLAKATHRFPQLLSLASIRSSLKVYIIWWISEWGEHVYNQKWTMVDGLNISKSSHWFYKSSHWF